MSETSKAKHISNHKHLASSPESEFDRPFRGCVAYPPERCNPAAHRGVRDEEVCACGARRTVNHNQGHQEDNLWLKPGDPDPTSGKE